MAAAALMSPASANHPHNPPFPPSYSHPPPPSAMPGITPQGESSRRTANDPETSQRQSLPSISEVFSAKPGTFSPTTPTTLAGSQSLPPPPLPFNSSAASRPEPGPEIRPPPPPQEDKFFRYPQRYDGSGAPGPVYQYGEQRELAKPPDPVQRNGGLPNSHAPQGPYNQPGQLPPGQLPFSQAPPMSPRHPGPPIPPYDPQRPPLHADDDFGAQRRYDPNTLNRHFEAWGYTDCLQRITWTGRTICNFADAYANIASEQHGGQPIPQRLPTEREVSDMLSNIDYLRKNMENVREVVQQSIANEKAREGGKHKASWDDDDVSMYGDGMKQHYGLGEVKKRRGRAAPPGRCHSCNRIDTPEWRRGPDGARTLCNACGLHYAKLERKRQMEQRSLRPKAVE
ncbi:GATA zinc finger protein [Xylariales sp. AK1849]|nr:GATA zinc finger protein [Xylariales sp. AK1849]